MFRRVYMFYGYHLRNSFEDYILERKQEEQKKDDEV